MKQTFLNVSVFLLFLQISFSQEIIDETSLNWSSSYKEALKKSKKEKKPILVYFKGSDWCGPCKVIDVQLFNSERFRELSENTLVLLEVDIPRRLDLLPADKMKENNFLKNKYKIKSFPTLLIIDSKGKVLAEKKGYVITDYYFPFIKDEIRKYKS